MMDLVDRMQSPARAREVPRGTSFGCERCGGSGRGNVCFPSDAAREGYCADLAAERERDLIEDLASTPEGALGERIRRLTKRHPSDFMDRVLKALQSRATHQP